MIIKYQSKEESNKEQQENFLKLSPTERFYRFLHLMELLSQYPTKAEKDKKNNFIIEIKV